MEAARSVITLCNAHGKLKVTRIKACLRYNRIQATCGRSLSSCINVLILLWTDLGTSAAGCEAKSLTRGSNDDVNPQHLPIKFTMSYFLYDTAWGPCAETTYQTIVVVVQDDTV